MKKQYKCITRRIALYSSKKRIEREREREQGAGDVGKWTKFESKVVNDMVNMIILWTMGYNSKPKHRYEFLKLK